jgi:hypothetical protein
MGTRNLTKVIDKDGEIRVAQYGQWDGYPEYSGTRALSFISEHGMLDKIEKSLVKCRLTTNENEVGAAYEVYSDEPKWESLREEPNGYGIAFPSLSRDTGVDILKVIVYSNEEVLLWNDAGFQNDQLMCEGIYTLDYKTREFESTYHDKTVKFSFDNLPTAEEYLKAFESEEVANA